MNAMSAPSAIDTAMSAPWRTPESMTMGTSGPTAARSGASMSAVAVHRSSCRPPWFESWKPVTPRSRARRASAGPMGPFSNSGPFQRARIDSTSDQFNDWSNKVPIRVDAALLTSSGDNAVKLANPIAGLRSIPIQ
jgi:hypothetical protein